MSKKIFTFLSLILVLSMLLAACTQTTPMAEVTEEAAPVVEATEEPAAPVATEEVAPEVTLRPVR